MIAFLKGTVAQKDATSAVIDVGGVGYACTMTRAGLDALGCVGEPAHVQTHMQVSDAGVALFGFADARELDAFKLLIGVGGVGPKMAIAALSTMSPKALAAAVHAEDAAAIARIPGVGKKTAARIILELKDKMPAGASTFGEGGEGGEGACGAESAFASADGPNVGSGAIEVAKQALLSMGFSAAESELALKGAPDTTDASALQYALRRLGS